MQSSKLSWRALGAICLTVLFLLLLWDLVSAAQQVPVTLSWTAPTANLDGSTPVQIGGYDIWVADTDAALSALPDTQHGGKPYMSVPVGQTSYRFIALSEGTHYFAVSTWVCPANKPCAVSPQSAHVSTTVTVLTPSTAPPGVPQNVTISATVTAPQ